jgi:hypothetical protein
VLRRELEGWERGRFDIVRCSFSRLTGSGKLNLSWADWISERLVLFVVV